MKKLTACFLFLLYCFFAYAQDKILLRGQVIDAVTQHPLVRAGIIVQGTSDFSITNDSGFFVLKTNLNKGDLEVSYIGYKRNVINYKYIPEQLILIKLERTTEQLKEVEVSKSKLDHLFVGESNISVLDYEFWDANTLVALYNYQTKKCSVVLLNKNNQIVDEQPLPANFEHFYYSCIKRTFAVATDAVYEISWQNGHLLVAPFSQKYFETAVLSYAGNKGKYFYIQLYDQTKMRVKYVLEDTKKKIIYPSAFIEINDTDAIRDFYFDLAFKAGERDKDMKKYQNSGSQIWDPYYKDAKETGREFLFANYMKQKHKDVYAPLFVMDSLVLIFDHTEGLIRKYSFDTEQKSITGISYMRDKKWNRKIIYDGVQGKFYALFVEDKSDSHRISSLKEIDLQKGNILSENKISYADVRNIKIRNNELFYLHNPFEATGNVFLFKEKMNP